MKHMPGHGRATADSHLSLPIVDASGTELEESDFLPFIALADLPIAMTAHVVYRTFDRDKPATTSETMVSRVIRDFIGFSGLLVSDDIGMQALSGDFAQRAGAAYDAGVDIVLHCSGALAEMRAVAARAPELSGDSLSRADAALKRRTPPVSLDPEAARAELLDLCRRADWPPTAQAYGTGDGRNIARRHAARSLGRRAGERRARSTRRWLSTSTASKARSIFCSRSRARRRSTSRRFLSSPSPTSISNTSPS